MCPRRGCGQPVLVRMGFIVTHGQGGVICLESGEMAPWKKEVDGRDSWQRRVERVPGCPDLRGRERRKRGSARKAI